ncbi:hypothetical protein ABZ582_35130 [Streptomyces syringium]
MLKNTRLGQLPEPWIIDWTDAYCMTGPVFYLTDWGRLPNALPVAVSDYLAQWLPVWIEEWAESENWELIAELLLADACLPEPGYHLEAWQKIAAVQRLNGHIPFGGQPASDLSGEVVRDHHHTAAMVTAVGALVQSRHRASTDRAVGS